jgi:beta-mannosidase
MRSLKKFLNPVELKIRSVAWEHHDNAMNFQFCSLGVSYQMLQDWLGRSYSSLSLEDYVLASGILQAEGLKEYILNYRRRWPSTSSAIYWDFNDSWPTVHGWGTIDYYLHRKLAFHPVRRAFSPITVTLVDDDHEIGVYAVNDALTPFKAKIQGGTFVPEGNRLELLNLECILPAFSSQRIATIPRDPTRICYALMFDDCGNFIAQDRLLLRPFYAWTMSRPDIQVRLTDRGGKRVACYESDVWVWSVVLDPSGESKTIDDVFDLLPGVPYDVPLDASEIPMPVAFTGNNLLLNELSRKGSISTPLR